MGLEIIEHNEAFFLSSFHSRKIDVLMVDIDGTFSLGLLSNAAFKLTRYGKADLQSLSAYPTFQIPPPTPIYQHPVQNIPSPFLDPDFENELGILTELERLSVESTEVDSRAVIVQSCPSEIRIEAKTNNEAEIDSSEPEVLLNCKICFVQKIDIVLQPCGHAICCSTCQSQISICPVCRKDIRSSVRFFIS